MSDISVTQKINQRATKSEKAPGSEHKSLYVIPIMEGGLMVKGTYQTRYKREGFVTIGGVHKTLKGVLHKSSRDYQNGYFVRRRRWVISKLSRA